MVFKHFIYAPGWEAAELTDCHFAVTVCLSDG